MLRLRALGSTYLEGPDGQPLTGAATQRRVLALLALLAAAGDEGLTRDRILGVLWAESEPERARHALTQTLYHARRALGHDDLFVTGGSTVRLERGRLTSDLAEFREAIAAGAPERAVALYRGPFLDGFYLNGAPGFEQWVAVERARWSATVADVLETLAEEAAERGAAAEVIRWCRQLVALDPLDSRRTAQLMEALAASGDPAGALQQARVHAELLRQELEIEPAEEVLVLERRLRAGELVPASLARGGAATAVRAVAASPASPASLHPASVRPPLAPPATSPPLAPPATSPPLAPPATSPPVAAPEEAESAPSRLPWWTRAAIGAGIGAVLLVGAVQLGREHDVPGPAAVAPGPVVVAPFRVTGADASLAFLREGMIELLAVRLADDSSSRAVDPGPVLRAWRGAGLLAAADVPREDAVRLAAQLGAERVVVGSVVGSPGRVVLDAALVTVADGKVTARATVEGSTDSLTLLVDRLAVRLLAADAGEGDRLVAHTTPSIVALRAYLGAQAAYRRGDWLEAMQRYEDALVRDSGFALAALQLALVADRVNDAEQHDRALAVAWREQEELSRHDRAHLVALAGPRYPEPSTEAEYLAAWERAAALAPDRADVWHELGERFLHTGAVLGADGHARAAAALRRALQLDPAHAASRELLVLVAARARDTAALVRIASPPALRDSLGRMAAFVRWRVAQAAGDAQAMREWYAALPRQDDPTLRLVAMASQHDGIAPEHGERALRIRDLRATRFADRMDVLLAQHAQAANAGRPIAALDVTERLEELRPGARAHLRLRVLDALYGDGDRAAALDAARRLGAAAASGAGVTERALALADACVLAQWRVAQGETAGVQALVARLRDAGTSPEPVLVGAAPAVCADLVDAQLAVAERRRDARARVARLDSLMLGGPAIGDAITYAHIATARLHLALGDRASALAAVRRRSYLSGWPRYLATARLLEGRLAMALGERERGEQVLRRWLALRGAPEASLAEQVADVRRLLGDEGRAVARQAVQEIRRGM